MFHVTRASSDCGFHHVVDPCNNVCVVMQSQVGNVSMSDRPAISIEMAGLLQTWLNVESTQCDSVFFASSVSHKRKFMASWLEV